MVTKINFYKNDCISLKKPYEKQLNMFLLYSAAVVYEKLLAMTSRDEADGVLPMPMD